jgi:hypothetical protein
MVGFEPGATSMKAIAPPPAAIGTYVSSAWKPADTVSGISGGDSRRTSPRGMSGGGRRSCLLTITVLNEYLQKAAGIERE